MPNLETNYQEGLESSALRALEDLRWWVIGAEVKPRSLDLTLLLSTLMNAPGEFAVSGIGNGPSATPMRPSFFRALVSALDYSARKVGKEAFLNAWKAFAAQVVTSAAQKSTLGQENARIVRQVLDAWLELMVREGHLVHSKDPLLA